MILPICSHSFSICVPYSFYIFPWFPIVSHHKSPFSIGQIRAFSSLHGAATGGHVQGCGTGLRQSLVQGIHLGFGHHVFYVFLYMLNMYMLKIYKFTIDVQIFINLFIYLSICLNKYRYVFISIHIYMYKWCTSIISAHMMCRIKYIYI